MKKQKNYQSGSAPIYIRITVGGKRSETTTGRECEPSRWNTGAGRANGTKEDTRAFNAFLDDLQTKVYQAHRLLEQEEEIKVLINPFISAYHNKAMAQLEGQIASAKIGLARLSSPQLYYVLSGNDFTLDVNNPKEPKIVSIGNNPQKLQIYGAVLSLYISRMIKLVNRKDQQKCSLVFDEFPTIYFNNIDSLIATARSNKVATTLAVQDFSQLKKDYGSEQADVITGIVGNVISGQVTGSTATSPSTKIFRQHL